MSTTSDTTPEDASASTLSPASDNESVFTEEVQQAYDRAIFIALSTLSVQVLPIHMTLALFYHDVTTINELMAAIDTSPPVDATLLWSALEESGYTTEDVKELVLHLSDRSLEPKPDESDSEADPEADPELTDPETTPQQDVQMGIEDTADKATLKIFHSAYNQMKTLGDTYLAAQHLLTALLQDTEIKAIFEEKGIQTDDVIEKIARIRSGRVQSPRDATRFRLLSHFSVDLTRRAMDGKLDPVVGRDEEVRHLMAVLSRCQNSNAILLGDPGVGKTAVAHALAQRIADRDQVPRCLNVRMFSLDIAGMISSTPCHPKLELLVRAMIDEIQEAHDAGVSIILHIDDIHKIMTYPGAGRMDVANLLTPALSKGILRCFGGTTFTDYSRCLEANGPLTRRFTKIIIREPTIPETIRILRGLRPTLEEYHRFSITDGALINATELAHRYLRHRHLPESAIDVVDEACSALRLEREVKALSLQQLETRRSGLDTALECIQRDIQAHNDERSKKRLRILERESELLNRALSNAREEHEAITRQIVDQIEERKKTEDAIQAREEEIENIDDAIEDPDARIERRSEIDREMEELQNRLKQEPDPELVDHDLITEVVADITRIPLLRSHDVGADSLSKDGALDGLVGSQHEAAQVLIRAYNLMRTGFTDSSRPTGSFLFVGPCGSGKSFVVKYLADNLFQSHNRILRIHGNEFIEAESLVRLVGTPSCTGFDHGGLLTEHVKRNPFSFLLVEHIDKACIEFRQKFQTIIDTGVLVDGDGVPVDFSNCILIMTAVHPVQSNSDTEDLRTLLSPKFTAEFLDRMDDIVIFQEPTPADVAKLMEIRVNDLSRRLEDKSVDFDVDTEARKLLGEIACDCDHRGAREVDRVVKQEVVDRLLARGPLGGDQGHGAGMTNLLLTAPQRVFALG